MRKARKRKKDYTSLSLFKAGICIMSIQPRRRRRYLSYCYIWKGFFDFVRLRKVPGYRLFIPPFKMNPPFFSVDEVHSFSHPIYFSSHTSSWENYSHESKRWPEIHGRSIPTDFEASFLLYWDQPAGSVPIFISTHVGRKGFYFFARQMSQLRMIWITLGVISVMVRCPQCGIRSKIYDEMKIFENLDLMILSSFRV